MALSLVTAPTVEPLTLTEAKLQCRAPLDVPDEDALISDLIRTAREYVETATHRALLTQTWDWKLDAFPADGCAMALPMANVTAVSSITYTATDGTSTAYTTFATDLPVGPKAARGRILPNYSTYYPLTRDVMNAVTVRFVAGYGSSAATVPNGIKQAMKLLVGHWYYSREAVVVGVGIGSVEVPKTVDALLMQYVAH